MNWNLPFGLSVRPNDPGECLVCDEEYAGIWDDMTGPFCSVECAVDFEEVRP